MAIIYARFVETATTTGLLTSDALARAEKQLDANKKAGDAGELARLLVTDGVLTKYQAAALYQDKADTLVLGNYLIIDKLGSGGMGQVFRARHRKMDRLVALKVLPKKALSSPDSVERFQREVRAAARLIHPNIVTALDADESRGTHFLVMEHVEGRDLSDLVKQQGPLEIATAVRYVVDAARGLEHAHGEGIVHRDIKPSNLILDKRGTVKILDMGLARIIDPVAGQEVDKGAGAAEAAGLTQEGSIMGTVDYMAPEQAMDTRHADSRADLYSLGCTLHYLVSGQPVYDGETLLKRILAHRDAPIPSLRSARAEVPEALDAVFQRLLAKKPDERFASAKELIEALAGALDAKAGTRKDKTSGSSGLFSPLKIAAAAVVLIAVAIGAVLFLRPSNETTQQVASVPVTNSVVESPSPPVEVPTKMPEPTLTAPATPVPAVEAPSANNTPPPTENLPEPEKKEPEASPATPMPPADAPAPVTEPVATTPTAPSDNPPMQDPEPTLASLLERQPVPDDAAAAKAEALMKEIFKDDLAGAKTPETKVALVTKLLQQASANAGDPAERYAMLCEARRLALDAGNVMLVRQTVAALADRFEMDARDELIGALAKMAEKTALPPATYKEVAETAAGEGDIAIAQHEWDKAKRLSSISLTAVRKSKDPTLTRQMVDHDKAVTASRQQWEAAEAALAAIEKDPNDAAAHLVAGRYLCFVQDDWDEGLKHLAASSDATLKELAAKSLASSNDATADAEIGDAWWDAAEKAKTKDKAELRQGANHWYTIAVDALVGLTKTRVERRLDELQSSGAPAGNAVAGGRPSPSAKLPLANGLFVQQLLDCGTQEYTFKPGPKFNVSNSWTLHMELMIPKFEGDHTIFYFGGANTPIDSINAPIYVKHTATALDARVMNLQENSRKNISLPAEPGLVGQWFVLTFRYDATNSTVAMAINGKPVRQPEHAPVPLGNGPNVIQVGSRPNSPPQRFKGQVRMVWLGNDVSGAVKKNTPPAAVTHPPQGKAPPANGLWIPQMLDCSARSWMFDVGPTFNPDNSWRLQFDFMSPSAEKRDHVLLWYGDNPPYFGMYIKYRGDMLEARASDGTTANASNLLTAQLDPGHAQKWTTLVFQFDAAAKEMLLLLNGEQVAKQPFHGRNIGRAQRMHIGARPGKPNDFNGAVRAIWLGNDQPGTPMRVAAVPSTSPPRTGVATPNGLQVNQTLDCSAQEYTFKPGAAFDTTKSWTLKMELLVPKFDSDRSILYVGDPTTAAGKTAAVIYVKHTQDSLQARVVNMKTDVHRNILVPADASVTGKWITLVLRHDATNRTFALTVDGKPIGPPESAPVPTSTGPLTIVVGGKPNSPTMRFHGQVRSIWLGND